jgi:hypothetical protein
MSSRIQEEEYDNVNKIIAVIFALASFTTLTACNDVDWGIVQEVWDPTRSDPKCSNVDYQVVVIKQPDGTISHTCVTPSVAKKQVVGTEFKPEGVG